MRIKKFAKKHAAELAALGLTLVLLAFFAIINPRVFLKPNIYKAVFTVLPIQLYLAVSLTFVVVSGESDMSFPSTMGVCLWMFTVFATKTGSPVVGSIAAIVAGILIGLLNGVLVAKIHLSSLVVTLGMNFLLRGLINIGTNGEGTSLLFLKNTTFENIFAGKIGKFPVQMIWGIAFVVICQLLFTRHTFGSHVCFTGDNPESARETGVRTERIKILSYVLVGIACAFAGILSGLVNTTFWPTTGDGYLLNTMAALYIGGTPTWGGVGTIIGSALGAFIMSFLETGIIACGLTGFFTKFFFGLIIILALISHKFSGIKRRQ